MIALLGILSILAVATLCSDNRRRIPLRTVGLALCLQILSPAWCSGCPPVSTC